MTELEILERKLAYREAELTLQSCCVAGEERDVVWFNTTSIGPDYPEVRQDVDECVRYLELAGKLERHPNRPELVRVLEL